MVAYQHQDLAARLIVAKPAHPKSTINAAEHSGPLILVRGFAWTGGVRLAAALTGEHCNVLTR
jgi:hypothetical protein